MGASKLESASKNQSSYNDPCKTALRALFSTSRPRGISVQLHICVSSFSNELGLANQDQAQLR